MFQGSNLFNVNFMAILVELVIFGPFAKKLKCFICISMNILTKVFLLDVGMFSFCLSFVTLTDLILYPRMSL